MAINEWWAGDPTERYWIEITDRETLGVDLHAPKRDQSGKETWSYSLVEHVYDGDIVFHYWKQLGQEKAIVGYSRATGSVESTTIRWQPHGTYGRTLEAPTSRPAWRFPLSDFTDLATPVTLEQLRALEQRLRTRTRQLQAKHEGPLYLPFVFSDRRPLRTAQGYLAKFPASFIEDIPELQAALRIPPLRGQGAGASATRPATIRKTGYQSDPEIRKAVERHAMNWALQHFAEKGYAVEDVGDTNPYDILAKNGKSELHIEVKGSAGTSTTVELTAGEVSEAATRRGAESVLVVVDQIEWTRSASGAIGTAGGRPRLWHAWKPESERLTPTSFRYLLPHGSTQPR